MIFIPVNYLREGMVLAQDVSIEVGGNPLLTRGQVLKDSYIRKLIALNIMGVYIESQISADIHVTGIIDNKLKKEALTTVKHVFEDFYSTNKLNLSEVLSIRDIAERLVMDILSHNEILINLIDLKGYDDYTYKHSLCVAIIAITVGVKLGLDEKHLNMLAMGGLLHDVGKMVISKEILNKPGRLSTEEYEAMKKHPVAAVRMLQNNPYIPESVLKAIESHHEKYDGTGYPSQLKGERIPYLGRILAVADVYDALTSERPYRKPCFPNEAIEYMMGNAFVHFDYDVLEAFLRSVAAYPAGMLVVLSSGQMALVVKNNPENTLRPIVRLVDSEASGEDDIDLLHDLQYHNVTIIGTGYQKDTMNYNTLQKNEDPLFEL